MHLRKLVGILFFIVVATTIYNPFIHIFYHPSPTNPQIQITGQESLVIPKTKQHRSEVITDRNVNQRFAELSAAVHEKNKPKKLPPPSASSQKYICFSPDIQWPDIMFAFASSYGIAKRYNMTVIAKLNILPFFEMENTNSRVRFLNDTSVCQNAVKFKELKADRFDQRILNLKHKPRLYIDGFFRSWKYFANAEKEVRNLFQFDEWLVYRAERKLEIVKNDVFPLHQEEEELIFVGIHMQIKGLTQNEMEYEAPHSYFSNAIRFFLTHFKHVIFLACSDSPHLADERLPDFVQIVHSIDPVFQMCLLSKCNHTIITSGAFGWWASWLANGITTYYQPSVKENSEDQFNTSNTDYYWPNWIPVFG